MMMSPGADTGVELEQSGHRKLTNNNSHIVHTLYHTSVPMKVPTNGFIEGMLLGKSCNKKRKSDVFALSLSA